MLVYRVQQAKDTELRELQENIRKMDEDCKMEVEDEADSRKTLEIRKMDITKDMRKFEGIKSKNEASEKVLRDNWLKGVAQNEQRRHDLLPEDEEIHNMSHKLQASLAKGMNRQGLRFTSCKKKWGTTNRRLKKKHETGWTCSWK